MITLFVFILRYFTYRQYGHTRVGFQTEPEEGAPGRSHVLLYPGTDLHRLCSCLLLWSVANREPRTDICRCREVCMP